MYLVFIHMPGESCCRRLRSLLCYVFRALINSLVLIVAWLPSDSTENCVFKLFCFELTVISFDSSKCCCCVFVIRFVKSLKYLTVGPYHGRFSEAGLLE